MPAIGAVIPAHNEENTVADVVRGSLAWADFICVVDDGSKDSTACLAGRAGATVLRHNSRLGKGCALKTGFFRSLQAGMTAVVTLDADGQHVPSEAPRLIREHLLHQADLVLGTRDLAHPGMPVLRRNVNRAMSCLMSWYARRDIADSQTGYRLYSRRLLENISASSRFFDFESELLVRACRNGFKTAFAPVSTLYDKRRTGHVSPVVDTLRFARLCGRLLLDF